VTRHKSCAYCGAELSIEDKWKRDTYTNYYHKDVRHCLGYMKGMIAELIEERVRPASIAPAAVECPGKWKMSNTCKCRHCTEAR
jgi:hypothetical protein